jgi:hypothetical protein
MLGSSEGSRLSKRDRQSAHPDPPEPASSGGYFIFWSTDRLQFVRRKPERETRIPGLAHGCARPKRGACRRERGASRIPMAERTKGSLWRRAVESAATEFVLQFGLPHCAAKRTLVVKISDTSRTPWWNSHLQSIVPWNPSGRMGASRAPVRRKAEPAFRLSSSDFARSPACFLVCRGAAMRRGSAVVKTSVTSGKSAGPLLRSGGRGFEACRQQCRSSVLLWSSNSVVCSPPTPSRSVVKIAVTSFAQREVAGSNPARRSMRR